MIGLLLAAAALGSAGDILEEVATSVHVNWTTLELQVVAGDWGRGIEDTEAVEQLARRDAEEAFRQGARRVRLDAGRTVGDLTGEPALASAVEARLSRWTVSESRYYASGRVEIVAALSLQDLLKPWTLHRARAETAPVEKQPRYTGLVVDARGLQLVPSWGPTIRDPKGEVLYEARLWEAAAVVAAPVVFVPDPAHPAAASRAGAVPMIVSASEADETDVVLDDAEAIRFRTALKNARILGDPAVVFVVDP